MIPVLSYQPNWCLEKLQGSLTDCNLKAFERFRLTGVQQMGILRVPRTHLPNICSNLRTANKDVLVLTNSQVGTVHIPTWDLRKPLKDNFRTWTYFRKKYNCYWSMVERQLCPLTARPMKAFSSPVMTSGVWIRTFKPSDVGDLLNKCILELSTRRYNKVKDVIKVDAVCVKIHFSSVAGDAPAGTFLQQVEPTIEYYGCDKCIEHGLCCGKRLTHFYVK